MEQESCQYINPHEHKIKPIRRSSVPRLEFFSTGPDLLAASEERHRHDRPKKTPQQFRAAVRRSEFWGNGATALKIRNTSEKPKLGFRPCQ
jgi:hypothetical protein